ncbi:F0F1 ATP synthase subunit B [Vallitalea okinawensis]|uniref:F0F1 ATP synthase subunit B n=1 Tax=Vallitalea okinawensis TaxID=2078660 RepID=UPI000CFB30F1|nr:F0F1 ATP synthase subunit B [Vallitalea okinawensis]
MSIISAFTTKAMNIAMLSAGKTAGEGEVVNFDLDLLIRGALHLIMILVLFYLLGKILFNPIREALKKRQEGIENDFNDITEGKQEVKELREKYEHKIAHIEEEADRILGEAHKKALDQQKDMINEAKEEAERIIKRAKLEIKREEEKARDEIKQEVIQVASLMASKFIASSMDPALQSKLLEESIDEIGDSLWKE